MDEIFKKICSVPRDDQHIVGLANVKGLLKGPYKKYQYALVIAKKLDDEVVDSISLGPNIAYYELYNDINNHLSELVTKISNELAAMGHDALPIRPTVTDEELSREQRGTLSTDFSHKMAGTRAGIGWIGKTALLVTKKFGPRVRLATVLTATPLGECGVPMEKSLCGRCDECIKKCPTGAANGKIWQVTTQRDEFYDPFKCWGFCKKISKKNMNKDISLCGICVSVCPVGRK